MQHHEKGTDMRANQDPDTGRGLYGKYYVERVHDPSGKHDDCSYFVLDIVHDEHAKAALLAYADSCESDYPALADDLRVAAGVYEPPVVWPDGDYHEVTP